MINLNYIVNPNNNNNNNTKYSPKSTLNSTTTNQNNNSYKNVNISLNNVPTLASSSSSGKLLGNPNNQKSTTHND